MKLISVLRGLKKANTYNFDSYAFPDKSDTFK